MSVQNYLYISERHIIFTVAVICHDEQISYYKKESVFCQWQISSVPHEQVHAWKTIINNFTHYAAAKKKM